MPIRPERRREGKGLKHTQVLLQHGVSADPRCSFACRSSGPLLVHSLGILQHWATRWWECSGSGARCPPSRSLDVLQARSRMTAAVQQELEKPQKGLAFLLLGAASGSGTGVQPWMVTVLPLPVLLWISSPTSPSPAERLALASPWQAVSLAEIFSLRLISYSPAQTQLIAKCLEVPTCVQLPSENELASWGWLATSQSTSHLIRVSAGILGTKTQAWLMIWNQWNYTCLCGNRPSDLKFLMS